MLLQNIPGVLCDATIDDGGEQVPCRAYATYRDSLDRVYCPEHAPQYRGR